jgi:hypothetical protein
VPRTAGPLRRIGKAWSRELNPRPRAMTNVGLGLACLVEPWPLPGERRRFRKRTRGPGCFIAGRSGGRSKGNRLGRSSAEHPGALRPLADPGRADDTGERSVLDRRRQEGIAAGSDRPAEGPALTPGETGVRYARAKSADSWTGPACLGDGRWVLTISRALVTGSHR